MRRAVLTACLILVGSSVLIAQAHTLIALGQGDHSINEIDTTSGKILRTFTTVDEPHEVAISADGKTIYASIPAAGHVVILDAVTFKEKGKIDTPLFHGHTPPPDTSSPHGMGLNSDGSKLYIGVENADVPGIVVYDTRAGKVLKKIDLALKGGHYLQVQPGTDKVYYPHRTDNRVVVVDGKTDAIKKIIDVPGGPVGVDFAPNGEVWIHEDGNAGIEGQVAIIDSKTDTVIKTIQTSGKGAGRMAVSRDGKWAASTHEDTEDVAIIDAVRKEVVATVPVGGGPAFPLFSPDNMRLYVIINSTSDVAVIDLKSMKVIGRWKAGEGTFGGGLRFLVQSRP